jgi:predicted NBD/HSP70 family sugar kinase
LIGNQALNNRLNSQRNKAIILNLVRMYPGLSRARLAKLLNLSRTAITDLVGDLLEQKLVVEAGSSQSDRGRKPVQLTIAPRRHFFLVIHIGGEHIRIAAVDLNCDILAVSIEKSRIDQPLERNLAALAQASEATLKNAGLDWDRIHAIGCGISAHVDSRLGQVQYSENIPGWDNVPLAELFRERYGKPCYATTARHLLILAERYYGKGRGVQNFLYLNIEVGIAMGIFAGGSLYGGAKGGAGEIGHIPVVSGGPLCNCGKTGCLERMASATNIAQAVQEALRAGTRSLLQKDFRRDPARITPEAVARAAGMGDLLASNILREAGAHIGKILVGCVQLLNPELIVMGGPIFKGGPALLEFIKESMKNQCLPFIASGLRIETSDLDYDRSFFIGGLILISERHWLPEVPISEHESLLSEYSMALRA